MIVPVCIKVEPASMLQHRAGQWWNCYPCSTHSIHRSPIGVKRRLCGVHLATCPRALPPFAPLSSTLSLLYILISPDHS